MTVCGIWKMVENSTGHKRPQLAQPTLDMYASRDLYQDSKTHIQWHQANKPVAQIPQHTSSISHNAPLCNRNVTKCCIVGYGTGALGEFCNRSIQGNASIDCFAPTVYPQWTSYQIRKIAGCACAGNAGNVFPTTDFKGNRQLAIPAYTKAHAALTCRDTCWDRWPAVAGKTLPAFLVHAQPAILSIWQEAHGGIICRAYR